MVMVILSRFWSIQISNWIVHGTLDNSRLLGVLDGYSDSANIRHWCVHNAADRHRGRVGVGLSDRSLPTYSPQTEATAGAHAVPKEHYDGADGSEPIEVEP